MSYIQHVLDDYDSNQSLSPVEKYQKKKDYINSLLDEEGIDDVNRRNNVIQQWIGDDPIATEGSFMERAGRSFSRGVDQLQSNIGAIGEYAGELTGIDTLREAGGDLYEEQKSQMDAQAPAYQSLEQEGTGFMDRIDDYANLGVESLVGSAPIAMAGPLLAASAPATLAGGIIAGTGAAVLSNAALEGGTTYAEQSRNENLGRTEEERRAKALAQANEVAIAQARDPELLANSVLSSVPLGKVMTNAGNMTRLGAGAVQQSGLEGLQEGRQYEVGEAARGNEVSRFDPEGQEQMIVGALTGAPGAAIDVIMDPRVDQQATDIYQKMDVERAEEAIAASDENLIQENKGKGLIQQQIELLKLKREELKLNREEDAYLNDLETYRSNAIEREQKVVENDIRIEERIAKQREALEKQRLSIKSRPDEDLKKAKKAEKDEDKLKERQEKDKPKEVDKGFRGIEAQNIAEEKEALEEYNQDFQPGKQLGADRARQTRLENLPEKQKDKQISEAFKINERRRLREERQADTEVAKENQAIADEITEGLGADDLSLENRETFGKQIPTPKSQAQLDAEQLKAEQELAAAKLAAEAEARKETEPQAETMDDLLAETDAPIVQDVVQDDVQVTPEERTDEDVITGDSDDVESEVAQDALSQEEGQVGQVDDKYFVVDDQDNIVDSAPTLKELRAVRKFSGKKKDGLFTGKDEVKLASGQPGSNLFVGTKEDLSKAGKGKAFGGTNEVESATDVADTANVEFEDIPDVTDKEFQASEAAQQKTVEKALSTKEYELLDKTADGESADADTIKFVRDTATELEIDLKFPDGKEKKVDELADDILSSGNVYEDTDLASYYEDTTDQTETLTPRQLSVAMRSLKNGFKSMPDVEVLADNNAVREVVGRETKPMEGFVKDGKIYVVAENLRGKTTKEAVTRAVQVFYHEGIGHLGLTNFMNNHGGFDNFMDAFGKNTRNRKKLRKWLGTDRGKQYKDKSERVQFEEYIASEFAEKGVRGVGTLEAVGESIRRVMGIKGSETALRQALQKVQKEMQSDGRVSLFTGKRGGKAIESNQDKEKLRNEEIIGSKISEEDFNGSTDEGFRASYLTQEQGSKFPVQPREETIFSSDEAQTMGGIKERGRKRMLSFLKGLSEGMAPADLIRQSKRMMMSHKDVYDPNLGEESGKKSNFNPNKYSDEEAVVRVHLGGTIKLESGKTGKGYTAHPVTKTGKPDYNKAMFYGPGFNIVDGSFQVDQNKRRDIALGKNKKGDKQTKVPMAGLQGKLATTPLSTEGKQVIFNPKTVHLFTESSTGLAVKGFKGEASAIGNTIYVRGELEYYTKENMPEAVDGVASESKPFDQQEEAQYTGEEMADYWIDSQAEMQRAGVEEDGIRESFMGEVLDAANPTFREPIIEKLKSVGQVVAKYADSAVNPVALIPKMQEYLKGRNRVKGRIDRLSELGKQIYDTLKKANPEQGERIYKYLTTVDADPNTIPEDEFREISIQIKDGIERIGEQAVASGVLARDQVNALKGQYLPRVYMKYLLGEDNSAFAQVLRSDLKVQGDWMKGRKNIDEAIRKIFLGEVEDPAYLAQKGIVTPGRDLAIIDFMDWISTKPEWAYEEQFTEFNTQQEIFDLAQDDAVAQSLINDYGLTPTDKPMRTTANYLLGEAKRIESQLSMFEENGGKDTAKLKLMKGLAERMREEGERTLNAGGINEAAEAAGFVKMPDMKKYGKLRGMYVLPEIKEDLTGAQILSDEAPNWLKNLVGEGGKIARFGSFFKLSKTALNFPAGHVRNFVSAASLAYFADVPVTKLPKLIGRAFNEMRTQGRYYNMAKDRGLMSAGFIAEEVKRVEVEYLNALKQNEAKGPWEQMWLSVQLAASKLGNKAGDLYQFGDEINRLVVLMDQVENKGIDPDTAAVHANKWIMDYSLARSWVKYGRTAVIGAPFLTYTAKIVPLMLETAVTKPTKFILPYALGHGMMEFTKAQFDWDDEDVEALKLNLPDYLRSKANAGMLPPALIPIPWKDSEGRIQFWDASYVYPWGIINELWSEISEGDAAQVLRTLGVMGSPLPQVLTAIQMNEDPFTQKEIIQPWMEPFDQIMALTDYAWNLTAPPFMHGMVSMTMPGQENKGFGVISRMTRIGDFKRGSGEPEKDLGQITGQAIGFNLTAVNPKITRERNVRQLERELSDIRSERKQVIQQLNRNKKYRKAAEVAKEFSERIQRKQKEIREYRQSTVRAIRAAS